MNMDEDQRNRMIITIVILGLVLLVGVGLLQYVHTQKHTVNDATITREAPISSRPYESVYPKFSGLENLQNIGVTADQITGLKYALYNFKKNDSDISKMTVSINDVVATDRKITDIGVYNISNFTVDYNQTKYLAKIVYSGFADVQVYLSTTNGSPLFDSGPININN